MEADKIKIENAHAVHKRYAKMVRLADAMLPESPIDIISFVNTGHGGWKMDANPGHTQVKFYLQAIFEEAVLHTAKRNPNMSLRGSYWLNYMSTVFTVILDAAKSTGGKMAVDLDKSPSMDKTGGTVGKLLAYAGIHYDVEPPSLKEDPVLAGWVAAAIEEGELADASWVPRQKEMRHRICEFPIKSRLGPYFMRDYFRWATGNENNMNWPQYVPSFGADEDEIEKTAADNCAWQRRLDKQKKEDVEFNRQMDLMEAMDLKIMEMGDFDDF